MARKRPGKTAIKKAPSETVSTSAASTPSDAPKSICGIVMPISALGDYTEDHWTDVRQILTDAIEEVGFEAQLVSDADDVGIIQKRIIRNLYDNSIVVCDVSGKNPNVMFELGMRLAFDKPTIIVKDDQTSYSFDTAPIEHLEYPRDLRFQRIVSFKEALAAKITGTHQKAQSDAAFTTFLGNFGTFKVAKLDETEVSANEYILDELRDVRLQLSQLTHRSVSRKMRGMPDEQLVRLMAAAIRRFASERGLRSKKAMREMRRAASGHVVRDIDAQRHFESPEEYETLFNTVFDLLY